jgi:hypothetical protein
MVWIVLELVRDVAAECAIGGGGEAVQAGARCDDQRSEPQAIVTGLNPSTAEIDRRDGRRQPNPITEDGG